MTHDAAADPIRTTHRRAGVAPAALLFWACLLIAALAPRAHAQGMQDVEPYVAVVTSERVPLRSGDMRQFYQVAELERGKMLLVVAESGEWARVRYPAGLRAYLAQEDGVVDGQTLTLIRPSRLRAVNSANPDPTASWKPLLAEPLPTNTRLPLVGRIPSRTNREFYLVEAPAQSVGYVTRSALRRATDAEAAAFQARRMSDADRAQDRTPDRTPDRAQPAPTTTEQPREPAARPAEPAPTREPERAPAPAPVPEPAPAVEPEDDDEDLLEPMVRPGDEPAPSDDPAHRPVTGDLPRERPQATPETEPEVIEQRAPSALERAAEPSEPAEPAMMSVDDLEAAFQAVLAQPVLEAEVDELLTEFRRVRGSIEESPLTERLRAGLDRRIAMLELRRDYRATLRQSESTSIDLEAAEARIARRIDDLARTDVYVAVGTLQPSSVYDGRRLPLLYRVRSVGDGPTRTLGYIAPTEDLDMLPKLGRIVGVVGFSERDPQRNILMLRARRVNVIDPADLGLEQD